MGGHWTQRDRGKTGNLTLPSMFPWVSDFLYGSCKGARSADLPGKGLEATLGKRPQDLLSLLLSLFLIPWVYSRVPEFGHLSTTFSTPQYCLCRPTHRAGQTCIYSISALITLQGPFEAPKMLYLIASSRCLLHLYPLFYL